MQPLGIDLFCGLGGWTEGLLAEGYRVVGFDNERHEYGEAKYPGQLVIQDVLTLHGSQFKDAALIVASPPCQEYSYMAMPWSRAKAIAADYRSGVRDTKNLTALFDACFRIQREASEAAGRHIPMVVENVKGAQPWVGRAGWHYGSFYLWGDIPALMPIVKRAKLSGRSLNAGEGKWRPANGLGFESSDQLRDETAKGLKPGTGNQLCAVRLDQIERPSDGFKTSGMNWSDRTKTGQDFTRIAGNQATKNNGGSWFAIAHNKASGHSQNARDMTVEGIKQSGISGVRTNGKGDRWFQDGAAKNGSKSPARKAASAAIAKIPFVLAQHIARSWKP